MKRFLLEQGMITRVAHDQLEWRRSHELIRLNSSLLGAGHRSACDVRRGVAWKKAVKLVVPFSRWVELPNGSGRMLGQQMAEVWKQPVIIDNKQGAVEQTPSRVTPGRLHAGNGRLPTPSTLPCGPICRTTRSRLDPCDPGRRALRARGQPFLSGEQPQGTDRQPRKRSPAASNAGQPAAVRRSTSPWNC